MCISNNAGETVAATPPAVQQPQATGYLRAFGLPDVSLIDLAKLSPAEKATVARALRNQLRTVLDHVEALCKPVNAMVSTCEADVFTAIRAAGGARLAHESLEITLETPYTYDANVAVLRKLQDVLSPGEIGNAVERKKIVINSSLDDDTIAKVRAVVGADAVKEEWGTHAGTLNRLRESHGPESAVGKIIAEGLRKVPGMTRLVIKEREVRTSEAAMRVVRSTEEADAIAEHGGAA